MAGFGRSVLVVSLGVDTYREDPVADLGLTAGVFHEVGRRVAAAGRRLVLLQEGGYHHPTLGGACPRTLKRGPGPPDRNPGGPHGGTVPRAPVAHRERPERTVATREMRTMPGTDEYPSYLDALEIGEERALRAKIERLQSELHSLLQALENARRGKRILYLGGRDLEAEVVRFMAEDLHFSLRRVDGPGGGFWVGDGTEAAFGFVETSEAGSVTKEHLAELMVHRSRAGRDESTPALLVVNTHRGARTLEERDAPVPPDVARRAAEDHIVVMRTIDLYRLQQRAANGFPAVEQVTEALGGPGGWFEVDASLNAHVHGPAEGRVMVAPPLH